MLTAVTRDGRRHLAEADGWSIDFALRGVSPSVVLASVAVSTASSRARTPATIDGAADPSVRSARGASVAARAQVDSSASRGTEMSYGKSSPGGRISAPPDMQRTVIGAVVAATLVAAFAGSGASVRSASTDAATTPPSTSAIGSTLVSLIDHSVVQSIDIGTESDLGGASVAAYGQ